MWPEKFDIIVANPPYSKKLDLKFLDKSFDMCEGEIVFVHPSNQYVEGKGFNHQYNKINLKINGFVKELVFFNGNPIFGINLFVPCVITHIDKKLKGPDSFLFSSRITDQNFKLKKTEMKNISVFGYRKEFINIKEKVIEKIKETGNLHDFGNVLGSFQQHKRIVSSADKFLVEMTHIRGHTETNKESMVKDDFFTIISKNQLFSKRGVNPKFNIWFEFDTSEEANNFITYLKTDFARICLALSKTNQHLARGELKSIPVVDFTRSWTDEALYAHFGINEEEQAFIREVIPPYYD